jgi:thiol-disulfide isomerase/thioredoxin
MLNLILLSFLLLGAGDETPEPAPRVTIVYFWATWCYPCEPAGKQLERLHQKYGERGLRVRGVAYSADGDPAAWAAEQGYTFEIVMDGHELVETYRVSRLPTVVVLDADGREIDRRIGYRVENEEELAQSIEPRLAAAEGASP